MAKRNNEEPLEMGGVPLHPGSRVGNYVFLREVGSGGMARVLLAKDPAGDLVALKVLRKNRFKTGLARFRREFRALSRIHHPNVIRVEAYGDLHGHPYIAMEYVDGPDLHATIRSFRGWDPERRWTRVEEILVDLCRSLAVVHKRGLVHRDLKPSNVLLTRAGTCKLTDFGIVKDLDPAHDPFLSTTLVGTWAYASPEQITGKPLDHRSDLYSLGVILFAMLTGKRPFVADDMAGYLELHRDQPAPSPRDIVRGIPTHLDEICRRLLQKAPRDRFQSAQEVLYRLEAEERADDIMPASGWVPPLVGRDLEQEALNNAIAALTDFRGGVLVLEGEDGSGKSRLLDLASKRSRDLGFPLYRLNFEPNAPAFEAVLTFAKHLAETIPQRQIPASLTEALGRFTSDTGTPTDARFALYDGIREGLTKVLEDQPFVLLLDNLHDAHPREIDLVAYLCRTLVAPGEQAFLVAGTLRAKANAAADAFAAGEGLGVLPVEMEVGPLSRADIHAIVNDLVGDSASARLLSQRLHKETEGNAYFVTEFLRSLQAKGTIGEEDGSPVLNASEEEIATGHLEIPLGVRQVMRARLEVIGRQDRIVLETLAVGGREIDLDILLDVLDADEEDVLDSIDRLLAAGIVRERRAADVTSYAVTHRKFADVVYRDLHPDRRSDTHRRMAGALELSYAQNPAALEVVGEHYRRAGDAGRAYRYLVSAAKRLADRSLVQEAWDITQRAGSLEESAMTDLPEDEFRALRREHHAVRAAVHYNRAEWADAERTWRAVLGMAEGEGDVRASTEAALELATVLRRRGRHRESRLFAKQALESSRRLHYREGVADALHCLSALAWSEADLEECERMATEGLLIAQGSLLADRRAELLLALTAAQATRGQLAAATRGLTEAEGIFRELRKKRPRCLALANIAELLTWQGEPIQARQRGHVAVQIATELDYKLGLSAAVRSLSTAAKDLGLHDEAREGLHRALETALDIDLPEEIGSCQLRLAELELEADNAGAAEAHARAAIRTAERRDPERNTPHAQAILAHVLASSEPEASADLLRRATDALAGLPIPARCRVGLALAKAHLVRGEAEAGRLRTNEVIASAASRGLVLVDLEARAVATHLAEDPDAAQRHRTLGQQRALEFQARLPIDMRRAFASRPFLAWLADPV
ncbi:MAG: serine/threonine protein kinase [Myxococcota bacterium]|jgi:serine/threonine protein kinase